jgi:hypothetical protein
MARCDFAEQHILPDNATEPTIRATQVIMHSIDGLGVTPLEQIRRWKEPGSVLESHFIVGRDGKAYQTMDTGRSADANLTANRRPDGTGAISIETEDNVGHADDVPWTDAQITTLIRLGLWAARTHDIPRRRCPDADSPGFGYHTLFGAPGPWTPFSKTCPGVVRIPQWEDKILPAIVAGRDPEVGVSKDDVLEALKDPDGVKLVRKAVWGGSGEAIPSVFGTRNAAQVVETTATNVQELVNIVRAGNSALASKITDVRSAVLGALAAIDTSSLPPAEREELARRIATLVNMDQGDVAVGIDANVQP